MPEAHPNKIGKYQIASVLGRGSMGVVYRAFDNALGRQVAIKTMSAAFPEGSELRLRFLREARLSGQLHHPNIVTVHDLFEEEGTAYLVMELLEGASLYRLLRREKPLELAEKLSILQQIARGLQHAHEHGIVHRDLKPGNVFVLHSGVVKVLDFGVAKASQGELTRAGTVFGTVEYMAPEQLRGETVDPRADIFSLGVIAHELLSGRNPFRAETLAASVFKILSDEPETLATPATGIPPAIDRIVTQALSKKTEARFRTMAEIVEAFSSAALGAGIEIRPPALTEKDLDSGSPGDSGRAFSLEMRENRQWSLVAAAAGELEQIYRRGIERFGASDYQGCVERMSQVLDEVPVHSLALHYLSQSEEKLRQKRLDQARHRQATRLLSEMRNAHRQGDSRRVLEAAARLLAVDPEAMEARWYRRAAEIRLTPSSRSRTEGSSSLNRISLHRMSTGMEKTGQSAPTLVVPAYSGSTRENRSLAMWAVGGAGALLVALISLAGIFTESRKTGASSRGTVTVTSPSSPASPVRPSIFDEPEGIVLYLPPGTESPFPSVKSAFPEELPPGQETEILVSGSRFQAGAQIVPAGSRETVEVISSEVAGPTLIRLKLRVRWGTPAGEISLLVENPNGNRSGEFKLRVLPL